MTEAVNDKLHRLLLCVGKLLACASDLIGRLTLELSMAARVLPEEGTADGQPPASFLTAQLQLQSIVPIDYAALFEELYKAVLLEIYSERYLTNDVVDIRGGFRKQDPHELRINGTSIDLDRREYVLIYVLGCQARTRKGLSSPRRVPGGPFLSTSQILDEIDRIKQDNAALDDTLQDVIYTDLHRIVFDLRKKIADALANPNLIQTGPRGAGYRLSTLAWNVRFKPAA